MDLYDWPLKIHSNCTSTRQKRIDKLQTLAFEFKLSIWREIREREREICEIEGEISGCPTLHDSNSEEIKLSHFFFFSFLNRNVAGLCHVDSINAGSNPVKRGEKRLYI